MSIKRIEYYLSDTYNPYINLSFEEDLLNKEKKDCMIFYLWQNQNTVVIGKNQSAQDECNLQLMEKDGITLARRSSGGGAVFQDLGNICFTFICEKSDFDIQKQLSVIQRALKEFGIEAYFSGRNDLMVDGFKISGQAYLKTKDFALHHGTILLNVDMQKLAKYLKTDKTKLASHGVKSHVQRVKNIIDFNPGLSMQKLIPVLKKAVVEVYDVKMKEMEFYQADVKKYSSSSYLYRLSVDGKKIKKRFDYGLIDINLKLIKNKIVEVLINSDLMQVSLIDDIRNYLLNMDFTKENIENLILEDKVVQEDVKNLLISLLGE